MMPGWLSGGIISIVYSQSDILKHEVRESPMASMMTISFFVQSCSAQL
jgi:hypothetical protein